jgi:hypothetical protein
MNSGFAPVSEKGNPYNSDLRNSTGLSTFKRLPKRRVKAPCLGTAGVNYYCKMTTYLLTYLLTPWSRVLLEKLTGSAASQKFPAFY